MSQMSTTRITNRLATLLLMVISMGSLICGAAGNDPPVPLKILGLILWTFSVAILWRNELD